MNFIDHINLLSRIDSLVKRKATGSPKQLAQKLNISRASLYRQLNILKNMNAPLEYCSHRQSYIYEEEFELKFP